MNEIEKAMKDVLYCSVGAVAAVLEAGNELAKSLIEKGQEAMQQGQERAEELKQSMKEVCDALMNDPGIDVTGLSRAQRDELRRRLDEMDAAEDAAAQFEACPQTDASAEDAPTDESKPAAPEMHVVEPIDIGVTYETGDEDDDRP